MYTGNHVRVVTNINDLINVPPWLGAWRFNVSGEGEWAAPAQTLHDANTAVWQPWMLMSFSHHPVHFISDSPLIHKIYRAA
jgi:hypothetical protein